MAKRTAAAAVGFFLWAGAGISPAAAQTTLEYQVKAAYLVRFTAFAEWPADAFAGPAAPMILCVYGRDRFGGTLEQAALGQSANGRPIRVRRVTADPAGCHILYVGLDASVPEEALPGVLVVTDAAVGPRRGAVHFALNEERVRFHIDLASARAAGVRLSSRLLNLALSVKGR